MYRNLWSQFKFAPDGAAGAGSGAAAAPAAPAAPATPPASPAPTSTPTPAPAAAAPAVSAPSAAGTPSQSVPVAPVAPSWLEGLRGAGVPVGKDEAETIETLKRIYQERQQLEAVRPVLPHLQSYQQHAQKFQAWLAEQQKAAAPASGEKPWYADMWSPPEYNPHWLSQVRDDGSGNLVPVPGAPPDVAMKLMQHQAWQREQAQKFMANPYEFLQGGIDRRATSIAEKVINDRLTEFQNRQAAQQFVGANQSWLYELDANNQPKMQFAYDQNGQPTQTRVLSQWGSRYTQHLKDGMEFGIQSQPQLQAYAEKMTRADYALASSQPPASPAAPAAPPATPQQQANDRFIAKNNPPAGVSPTNGNAVPAPVKVTGKNLEQRMREAFRANGLTDQVLTT